MPNYLSNNRGTGERLALLFSALGSYGQPNLMGNTLGLLNAFDDMDEREAEREERRQRNLLSARTADTMASDMFKMDPGATMQSQLFGNGMQKMSDAEKAALASKTALRANPEMATTLALQRAFAPKAAPVISKPGDIGRDAATNEILFENPTAPTEDTAEWRNALKAAGGDPRKAQQLLLTKYQTDTGGAPERWDILPAEEARRRNLPEGFTYQVSSKTGKIEKLTEPKQEKPTAGENTAVYHGRRLASSIKLLNDVLTKEPGAITSIVPGDNVASKALRSTAQNRIQSVLPEIGDALLTLGTGAAYNKEQFENQWTANLPAYGDSDEVIADKLERVQALYEQAKVNAGTAGVTLPAFEAIANIYRKPQQKTPPGLTGVGGSQPFKVGRAIVTLESE